MAEETVILDILGNQVFLPEHILQNVDPYLLDKIRTAISKPALVIEEKISDNSHLHYFRSAEWHETLLLTAVSVNHHWELVSLEINPTHEQLTQILKKGKQVL